MIPVLAEDGELSNWVMIFVIVGWLGFAFLTVMLIRERIGRRQSERPSARQMIDEIKQRAGRAHTSREDATPSPEDLQAAQDLAQRLDAKASRIESLLDRAEAVSTRLDEQVERFERAVDDRDVADAASADGVEGRSEAPAAPPQPPSDPLARSIYELADQGRSPVQIAQELDEQVGKVELILALRES